MEIVLWILAAFLVLSGIKKMFTGDFLLGIVFIVVGLLVGPGGTSLFVQLFITKSERSRQSRFLGRSALLVL